MNLPKLVMIAIMAVSAAAAHADTISYSFTSFLNDFSFTSPFIINTDTIIPASSLLTNNTPNLVSVEINPTSQFCANIPIIIPDSASCVFFNQPTQGTGYYFSSQLTSLGIYVSGNARLDISRVTDASPVPEPSSVVLLVTGLSGALVSLSTKTGRATISGK
jgi:hypothetical protein